MIQSISCTNKPYTLLYYYTNNYFPDYKRIFFSDMKLSKEFCVHHIEHEPVLLTVENKYFCMITHQIHPLLNMQGCDFYFHCSILGMYPIEL